MRVRVQYLPAAVHLLDESELKACNVHWQVIDVGGQRNERRKWLPVLDDARCLVWMCGLTEYLQVMYEESSKVRVLESLDLFAKWANQKQFHEASHQHTLSLL